MTTLSSFVQHPYIAGAIAHAEALDALVAEIKVREEALKGVREIRIIHKRLASPRVSISEADSERIWSDWRQDWRELKDEAWRRKNALEDAQFFIDAEV
ncbi:hypothetical protein [Acidiferrobacter sp.]|uniref:hypothetical protein n=1 Tax=Acidiferrobacter sp. TaxID=1872107 RepID=UPI002637D0D7|nr:hypothetical protein [Acidiferrobacter sp.]